MDARLAAICPCVLLAGAVTAVSMPRGWQDNPFRPAAAASAVLFHSAENAALRHACCWLSVQSAPAGAAVEVDGTPAGATPSLLKLPPGSHRIIVKKQGFGSWADTLNLTAGSVSLRASLQPTAK